MADPAVNPETIKLVTISAVEIHPTEGLVDQNTFVIEMLDNERNDDGTLTRTSWLGRCEGHDVRVTIEEL